MWRQPPRLSREGEAEWPRARHSRVCTSPDKPAHHPNHLAHPPPAPHPSANKCTDKSFPGPAASSKPPDKTRAARSAYKDRKVRRSPAPPTTQSRASANLPSLLVRTAAGSAANPNLRCGESTGRPSLPPAAPRSRMCAHGRRAAVRSAKAQAARGRPERNQLMTGRSLVLGNR